MDYLLSVFEPLKVLMGRALDYLSILTVALFILFIGWILARGVRKLFDSIFHMIQLDKIAHKAGIAAVLRVGGIRHKTSELLSCMLYWVVIIMTLIAMFKVLGLAVVTYALDSVSCTYRRSLREPWF